MDSRRFDDLSRSVAVLTTRRRIIRSFGNIGLLATVLALVGLRQASARATQTCVLDFVASVLVPGEEEFELEGVLTLLIAEDGSIDDASLKTDDASYDATGQTVGRSLALVIELNPDGVLYLNGVGTQDLASCRGEYAGTFAGPDSDQMGTWWSQARGGVISKTTSSGTDFTGTASGGFAVATLPPATGSPEPACPGVDCGTNLLLDPSTCECGCPEPFDQCGEVCCYGGSTCVESTSSCSCPSGSEPCQAVCATSCAPGKALDKVTCQCVQAVFCDSPYTECNGVCVDVMTSDANCSACGMACAEATRCEGGICVICSPLNCTQNSDCCSGYCQDYGASGTECSNCDPPYTICGESFCADLMTSNFACGACNNVCGAGAHCQAGLCMPDVAAPSG